MAKTSETPGSGHAAEFRPFIPAEAKLPELNALPLIVGTLLGIIFGASSLYLVLKVGLTVSASIPVAVIAITLFKLLGKVGLRGSSILENNIMQTAGSAGESIAFGVGVTMPAILILGFGLEFTRVMLVAVLGGLLGILMMIPLRRALIVKQHGLLKYPEGTACAEVLKAAASDEERKIAAAGGNAQATSEEAASGAKAIFVGFGLGLLYKAGMAAFKLWKDVPEKVFGAPFKAGSVSAEISPELLGVGYIIGPRIASIMCAGGVLAYLVLIPAIKFFGEGMVGPVAPGTVPIAEMGPHDIRGAYVLYIGAGAVAAGGIISLFRSLPTIWSGLREGLKDMRGNRREVSTAKVKRTDEDLPFKFVLIGILVLMALIVLSDSLYVDAGFGTRLLGALMIIIFGFLFVTVSSRLTGEIGSSSNPISGMTVATLLLVCLIFLALDKTGQTYYVTALSIGAIVCIASSNGGTTSQDLKTGFLVGGTPKLQQIAILVGALASAVVLGPILLKLNEVGTVYVPRVTYEEVKDAPAVPADRSAALSAYADPIAPPVAGAYRSLSVTPAEPLAGVDPGTYLVDGSGKIAFKRSENFPAGLVAPAAEISKEKEALKGVQAKTDSGSYGVWFRQDPQGGAATHFLVDAAGAPVYMVDPGINGTHRNRPDGSRVDKFDAPKATLMSYIIKGILNRQLPWGLVLLGVMIALVLEMSGIPSLAFAVGVYLPLSSSSPIFIGGMVRWLVDLYTKKKFAGKNLTEDELTAEGDKSPGVLMASGYIAGGAIAGIVIAFMAGVLGDFTQKITDVMSASNPFFEGPNADLLALIPFAVIVVLLYLAGRETILARKAS